jgi:DNA-binding CsgD family transcriptional regulator
MEALYISASASRFLEQFHAMTNRSRCDVSIPSDIKKLCQVLVNRLPAAPEAEDWALLYSATTIHIGRLALSVRIFGIPDPSITNNGRLLLVLTPAESNEELTDPVVPEEHLRLTPRERSVSQHLIDGLTNKEIAGRLNLSEHTVKDHLKRLMRKTKTTTRTGVVRCLLSMKRKEFHAPHSLAQSVSESFHELAI